MKSVTLIVPRAQNKCGSDISVLTTPLSDILILGTMLKEKGNHLKNVEIFFTVLKHCTLNN